MHRYSLNGSVVNNMTLKHTRVLLSTPESKKRRIELQKLADYHLKRIKEEAKDTSVVFKRNKLTGEVCYY